MKATSPGGPSGLPDSSGQPRCDFCLSLFVCTVRVDGVNCLVLSKVNHHGVDFKFLIGYAFQSDSVA